MSNEIRIAVIGNVDSAKTTTIGVITTNILDDGKGLSRANILKHPHEKNSGRTSCVTQNFVKIDNKIFNFVDLAGHEKYLRTTISGLNGYFINYAMLTIGADRGIIGMTKEHISVALALKIPIYIVITKKDIAQEQKLNRILNRLKVIFKSNFAGKKETIIVDNSNIDNVIESFNNYTTIPIFITSNVTGENMGNLRKFIYKLKTTKNIGDIHDPNCKFIIDSRFRLPGIGIIVTGITKDGEFKKGDKYFIGPFRGIYKEVVIKSIHDNFHNQLDSLCSGQGGCFNIKPIHKRDILNFNSIRKGHILIKNPSCIWRFTAKITILHHPTTIKVNYEPTIHCGIIKQNAKIYKMNKELVRVGDNAIVEFHFLYKPEYIEKGQNIVFREGRTKGIGKVLELLL